MHRRMMRLPAPPDCPVELGRPYRLQVRRGVPAELTITPIALRCEPLGALEQRDARREGYGTVEGALRAWRGAHGQPAPTQEVWVVSFVVGDHSAFFGLDEDVYLAKYGDYTTRAERQAVSGDPPVMLVPGSSERSRVMSIARRNMPLRDEARALAARAETLRESIGHMKARQMLRKAARDLAAAESLLGGEIAVNSGMLGAAVGAHSEVARPPRAEVSACRK